MVLWHTIAVTHSLPFQAVHKWLCPVCRGYNGLERASTRNPEPLVVLVLIMK